MPFVLALDWDPREIRYALGMRKGRNLRVLALGALAPPSATDEADPGTGPSAAAQLNDLLARHRANRPSVLVVLPRASVELQYLTVPPTTDDELPELVANLIVQQSPTLSDQALVDFVPGPCEPGMPRPVLAAALSDERRQQILAQFTEAGLTLDKIVLRSLAGVSLLQRLIPELDQTSLLIYRVGRELELAIVSPGHIGFSRTVRLPDAISAEDAADRLITEARRTVLAAPRDQIDDGGVRQVFMFGSREDYESLAADLGNALSLPVEVLDPLGAIELPEPISRPAAYAPLLGALLDEAAGVHALDLLHPRRSPPAWMRWRLPAAIAAALAVAAVMITLYVWGTVAEANAENDRLAARLRELNETARKAVSQRKRIEAVAAWKNRDVNWLDELRDLSERFPGPRDAVVLRMSMRPASGAGGLIDVQGLVRDPKIVVNMERQVRDSFRTVRSRRVQQRTADNDYTWLYETSVSVAPRRPDQYPLPVAGSPSSEPPSAPLTHGPVQTPAESSGGQLGSGQPPAAAPAAAPAETPAAIARSKGHPSQVETPQTASHRTAASPTRPPQTAPTQTTLPKTGRFRGDTLGNTRPEAPAPTADAGTSVRPTPVGSPKAGRTTSPSGAARQPVSAVERKEVRP